MWKYVVCVRSQETYRACLIRTNVAVAVAFVAQIVYVSTNLLMTAHIHRLAEDASCVLGTHKRGGSSRVCIANRVCFNKSAHGGSHILIHRRGLMFPNIGCLCGNLTLSSLLFSFVYGQHI